MAGITSSGDISVSKSAAANTSIVSAVQTDNTSGSSNARLQATAGGASGGDAFSRYTITGATDWSAGADNSDGDAYVITPSTTPGGATNGLRISTAGAVTIPGTLGVTGTTTFSGAVATGLTASRTLITDGSGNMAVNTETGTGSHVRATSPTITTPTFSGTIASGLTASRTVVTDGSGNLAVNTETGTGSHVRATSPTLVTPAIGAATGTSLNLSGNLTADSIVSTKFYEEGSYTGTLTGCTTSPTETIYFIRVGKLVTLMLPNFTGTSNAAGMTITGAPASIRPARQVSLPFKGFLLDNGVRVGSGLTPFVFMTTSGTLNFGWTTDGTASYTNGSFTTSGTKGIAPGTAGQYATLTYTLQ
jgi:hypothetical protein